MSGLVRTRRSMLKPVALGLGALVLALGLVVGGWFLWIALRPGPEGFAPSGGQAVGVADQLPDVLQYTMDARNRQEWVYFDFSSGKAVSTLQENLDWDLAFRRNDILTNSGETNPDGLGGAVDLGKAPLEEVVPPVDGYVADATDDEDVLANPALDKWYNYSWTTHIISSKNHTYAVRTATGEVALLTFVSYYCDDGSSGCVTFRYLYSGGL